MDSNHIVDGRVRRDDDGAGRNGKTVARLYVRLSAAFDLCGVSAREYSPAIACDRAGQPREVFHRVKLPLARKAQAGSRVE